MWSRCSPRIPPRRCGARSGGGNQGEAIEEATAPVVSKVDQRRLAAEKREALKPLKRKITNLEVQMSRLQATIKDLDEKLADPALYTRDPAKAADLGRQKSSAEKTLEKCEADWLEFTEEHDSAMAD